MERREGGREGVCVYVWREGEGGRVCVGVERGREGERVWVGVSVLWVCCVSFYSSLHDFTPHAGDPVTRLIFCDNHTTQDPL